MLTKGNKNFSNSIKFEEEKLCWNLDGFTLLAKLTLGSAFTTFCSVTRFTVQKIQITEKAGKLNQTEAKAKSSRGQLECKLLYKKRPVQHYQLGIHARLPPNKPKTKVQSVTAKRKRGKKQNLL